MQHLVASSCSISGVTYNDSITGETIIVMKDDDLLSRLHASVVVL